MANEFYESGIIGSRTEYSTWGKFRVLFRRATPSESGTLLRSTYNREYPATLNPLKASGDGSGWIRKAAPEDINSPDSQWFPRFFAATISETPPTPDTGYVILFPESVFIPVVSDELKDYLTDGYIYTDGGDLLMDSTFWANGGGPVDGAATTVNSVDGLEDC
jgi:hypothetical protein